MPPTIKASPSAGGNQRTKKSHKSLIVTLKLSPKSLAVFAPVTVVKEEINSKTASSTTSNTLPGATSSPGENASDSNANTPAPSGAEGMTTMPPPTETIKKTGKGVKRTSAAADGLLKPRGKPGPKKKAKLEDGSIDPSNAKGPSATGPLAPPHKLGPKANQGAINAGLRALDRSGKPCRKWAKGSFTIKSFTGTVWEIPRWQAPSKASLNGEPGSSTSGSSKENKESSHIESEKSNTTDLDIKSSRPPSVNASSPAPIVAAVA